MNKIENPEDIIGQHFGQWEVLEYAGKKDGRHNYMCRCACGNTNLICRSNLTRGLSRSCGRCIEPWIEDKGSYFVYHTVTGDTFKFSGEDYDLAASGSWYINANGYPVRTKAPDWQMEFFARTVTGAAEDEFVDHINMDTRDNRRENMRICSWSDNNCNKVLQSNNKSGYKGVSAHSCGTRYVAVLWKDGVRHYGGLFESARDAAMAYDEMARKYHGEYARLNFPQPGERGCREAVNE